MSQASLDQLEQHSRQQTDYYAEHLGELDEVSPVVSTEDIITTTNIPLVKKGARITKSIAQQILQHKLNKPLESQVQIERCIDGEALLNKLDQLMDKYPDLRQVHDNAGLKRDVENLIKNYILPPLLAQKLTVLHFRLAAEFEKTLFCTWLAVSVALIAKLDDQVVETTYIAGLGHDLGVLHISPHIFTKQGQLNAEEWRAIQSHVVISYLWLKNIGGRYIDSAHAVLEHHERCDGTGYPLGKTAEQLDIVGQVIAIADTLQAIRVNQLEESGRNLRDVIPFLQMNVTTYKEQVSRAATMLLKRSNFEIIRNNQFDNVEALIDRLLTRGESLDSAATILQILLHLSNNIKLGPAGQTMMRTLKPVIEMIRRSGIIEDHIFIWLRELAGSCDEQCLIELNDMELMQNELFFQLKKARSSFITFLAQEPEACNPDDMKHFNKLVEMLENFL